MLPDLYVTLQIPRKLPCMYPVCKHLIKLHVVVNGQNLYCTLSIPIGIPKYFTLQMFTHSHIHTLIHTMTMCEWVLNCSYSCPRAHWQRRGCHPPVPPEPSDHRQWARWMKWLRRLKLRIEPATLRLLDDSPNHSATAALVMLQVYC